MQGDCFVLHPDLGFGRYHHEDKILHFFVSPSAEDYVLPLAGQRVKQAELERQQRVWRQDGSRWVVGRIDSADEPGSDRYYVDFPNGQTALVAGKELCVRWSRPIADPVELLQFGAVETRFFRERRSAFLRNITSQTVACEGLGGVLSSVVDLFLHQVGAARRVLLDPVRRYLLADEVGLGKTIEAGMVLRQLLLDSEGEALVLAPETLVGQWEDELASKFRVAQFRDRVRVHPPTKRSIESVQTHDS